MNKRIPLFIVSLMLFLCLMPLVLAADPPLLLFKVLPVPLFAQQTRNWCWAASGEMIMTYLGKQVSQCDQANSRLQRGDCCQASIPRGCIRVNWPDFRSNGFTFSVTPYGTALKWEELVTQIDSSRPVGFSWEWLDTGTRAAGHFMVVRGYLNLMGYKLVLVNDPAPPNRDKHRGGSFKVMSYDYYLSSPGHHTHWYDQYDIKKIDAQEE